MIVCFMSQFCSAVEITIKKYGKITKTEDRNARANRVLERGNEELNERIEGLEAQLDDVSCSITDNDALSEEENVLEFSFLDSFSEYTDENIIILHSNPYRTFKLVNSCKPSCGIRQNMYEMSKLYLTADYFSESLSRAQRGEYIALCSEVFDFFR